MPAALVLALAMALRVGLLSSTGPFGRDALLRGLVFAVGISVVGVRLLGGAGRLTGEALLAALVVATVISLLARRGHRLDLRWSQLVSFDTVPIAAVAAFAMLATAAAAYLLPIWQWDALGYHLPYVNFALERGSLADVPPDVPYVSTYPHVVEDYFIAWRAMLPDDRLIDAAQIPLGVLGAVAIAVLGRHFGARPDGAVAAGFVWLTLPAVFLQLPTNYIDVATAAFLLSAMAFTLGASSVANVIGGGVALGLLLGSKPNAPVPVALLAVVLFVRGWRGGRRWSLVGAAALVLVLGAESYVRNIALHGNPIWPVRLSLGPIALPGLVPMRALLDSGCAAPRLHGPLPIRIIRSWASFDAPPVFDMRYGGLGVVFLAALPAAAVVAWRTRSLSLIAAAVATLASPDPVVPRYILAFPGLVFAAAAPVLDRLGWRSRRTVLLLVAAGQGVGLLRAYPGLVGEGPPLSAYAGMTEHERLRAVGADGSPAPFHDALERLRSGDITVFDGSLELPYLAWRPDLATRAVRVDDEMSMNDVERILEDPRVRLLIVSETSLLAAMARHDDTFTAVHRCKPTIPSKCLVPDASFAEPPPRASLDLSSSCVVFSRR